MRNYFTFVNDAHVKVVMNDSFVKFLNNLQDTRGNKPTEINTIAASIQSLPSLK